MTRYLRRRLFLLVLFVALTCLFSPGGRQLASRFTSGFHRHGPVIHEATSDFSHIRVRERDGVRRLLFVDPHGAEALESAVDLGAPGELQLSYSRAMFLSFLFYEAPERILLVGLGGGGMVRFLQEKRPEIIVEALEIDSAVVAIAKDYFGADAGPRTVIHTIDAFEFLAEPHGLYDTIFLDAFLQPPVDSGLDSLTKRLKTEDFLRQLRGHLSPEGVAVFNLIERDPGAADHLAAIHATFGAVYEFSVPRTWNVVVIATQDPQRLSLEQLLARAEAAERSGLTGGLPLRDMTALLRASRSGPQ